MKLMEILKASKECIVEMLQDNSHCISYEHAWLWYREAGLPCLVAHIDNVYEEEPHWHIRKIIQQDGYYWSPDGIAGDDRCGVYALMRLFGELKVNCLFTDGEESGGIGANEIVKNARELLIDTPYFIQIDRRGVSEAVFYNDEDKHASEFHSIVGKYFTIKTGTFSDISIIGNSLNIASVNLSAGFYNEHQRSGEYIYEPHLNVTILKVPMLIEELGSKQYKLPANRHKIVTGWNNWKDAYRSYRSTYYDWIDTLEIYEGLLEDVEDKTPMNELVFKYAGLVSMEELKKIKRYLPNKQYRKLVGIVAKIEKEEVW